MKVTLRLYASLRMGRFDTAEFEIGADALIADAVAAAGLAPGEAAVIFRNTRRADAQDRLAEGDRLELFPPVGGG